MNSIPPTAPDLLEQANQAISARAQLRDQPDGERSMKRTVTAFNAMFGKDLTVEQGWHFMVLLKMARSAGGKAHLDDFLDGAAYFALAGEEAAERTCEPELLLQETLTIANVLQPISLAPPPSQP